VKWAFESKWGYSVCDDDSPGAACSPPTRGHHRLCQYYKSCQHPAEQRVWQSNWQFTCEQCKAIVPCPEGAMGGHLPPLRNQ
jgi:hypothetical protein